MKPMAPRFVVKKKPKKTQALATGLACVLCPSLDATRSPLYRDAALCDRCRRNQTIGGVARVLMNAAGKYLLGGPSK